MTTGAPAPSADGSMIWTLRQRLGLKLYLPGWKPAIYPMLRVLGVGSWEFRLHFGPGYRLYFGRDGDALIVLLGGGTKIRQQRDIENTLELWQYYRRRKQQEV